MRIFQIGKLQEDAAQLLADGELTDTQIADKLNIARSTLWDWKQRPEFVELIDGHHARFREQVRRRGLANPDRRVRALNDRWNRLQRVIEARADHQDYAEAPGGKTGLLVKTTKMIGSGENARAVDEFAVDAVLLRELREHEKQAAQELGQWVEKRAIDQTVSGRIDFVTALACFSTDELDALDALAAKLAGGPGPAPDDDPGREVPEIAG